MLVLRNGRIVTPTGIVEGGIVAEDGVITHVGRAPACRRVATRSTPVASGCSRASSIRTPTSARDRRRRRSIACAPSGRARVGRRCTRASPRSSASRAARRSRCDEPHIPMLEKQIAWADEVSYADFAFHAIMQTREHLDEQPGLGRARGRRLQALLHGLQAGPRPDRRADLDRLHRRRGPVRQLRSARPPARRRSQRAGDDPCRGCRHLRGPRGALRAEGRTDLAAWAEARPDRGLPDSQRGRGRDLEGDRLPALHRPHHHGR